MIKTFSTEDRTEASRVLQIKRYAPSFHYYGVPDYVGSTGYIELDNKIQVFHLSNISNGLFPSMMVSFNNGVPTDEEQRMIEQKVNEKFGGASGAGKVLITFNDGTETQPTFTPVQNNGSDGMYEYLSNEVTTKVLTGHRCTSPLLFGVKGDGSGFGNNADELRDSYSLFHNTVIIPFQDLLLDGLNPVLEASGINLDLFFIPLKPADFMGISMAEGDDTGEVDKSYTGIQISAALDIVAKVEMGELSKPQGIQLLVAMLGFTQEAAEEMFLADEESVEEVVNMAEMTKSAEWLIEQGEDDDDDEWELIDEREVNYEAEAAHNALWAFAGQPSVIPNSPNKKSEKQDTPMIKVRYVYAGAPIVSTGDGASREFCKMMVSSGKVYRMEDIEAASGSNPGFGRRGANNYDIFLYKGGPRCRHYWQRRTYLRKTNKWITVGEAKKLINTLPPDERYEQRIKTNDPKVAMWPDDMKHKGFDPSNPNLPSDAR